VENLLSTRIQRREPDRDDAVWLDSIGDALRDKLERVDLVVSRVRAGGRSLGDWLDEYMAMRLDIKAGTRRHLRQTRDDLLSCCPREMDLQDFTPGHAEGFRRFLLEKGSAESTVRRRCKRVKQIFTAAIKRRILSENPFDGIPTSNVANAGRQRFIDCELIQEVIDACPCAEWRLIFALARYGGLRIPSELYNLKWSDVLWDQGRFIVHSPKTEHIEGKGTRSAIVPRARAVSAGGPGIGGERTRVCDHPLPDL
jgi:integrase